jgi:putative ABC transport system permease protein
VAARLARRLAPAGLDIEVVPWTVFSPEIASYVNLAASLNWLVVAIVFTFAIFGVANTMLMGTFERRREFAVVRALGTVPSGVALTILFEGLALGLLSLAAGAVLTAPLLVFLHSTPLSLTALVGDMAFAGALIRPVVRVEYSLEAPLLSAAGLLVTAVLAALYPAIRAMRVPPADALAGR